MKKFLPCLAVSLTLLFTSSHSECTEISPLPDGFLMYHSYTSYDARDSRLYIYDTKTDEISCINDCISGVYNIMNGDFGNTPYDIVFMGMTAENGNEQWDIFRYNTVSKTLTDLSDENGLREEDIKFSPDGRSAVFKQGRWNFQHDCMEYSINVIDLESKNVRTVTEGIEERSMPYFSDDGEHIYYSKGTGENAGIYMTDLLNGEEKCIFRKEKIQAYYPVVLDDKIYFTKWFSPENRNDCIFKMNTRKDTLEMLPFCNENFNCSDPFPISSSVILTSTTAFSDSYDIAVFDSESSSFMPFPNINTESHELGSAFFSSSELENDALSLKNYLLTGNECPKTADMNDDGIVNAADLCLMLNASHMYS